jgi:hypothetical protein
MRTLITLLVLALLPVGLWANEWHPPMETTTPYASWPEWQNWGDTWTVTDVNAAGFGFNVPADKKIESLSVWMDTGWATYSFEIIIPDSVFAQFCRDHPELTAPAFDQWCHMAFDLTKMLVCQWYEGTKR